MMLLRDNDVNVVYDDVHDYVDDVVASKSFILDDVVASKSVRAALTDRG